MALALTSFGSLRAPNLLPADLSAPGHQTAFFCVSVVDRFAPFMALTLRIRVDVMTSKITIKLRYRFGKQRMITATVPGCLTAR